MGKIGPDGRDVPSTRPLLDKLGVKPGLKVSVIGLDDPAFLEQLQDRSVDVSSRARKGSDLIFFYLDDRRDLPRLAGLRASLKPAGALWALWPKGRREFREDDIRLFEGTPVFFQCSCSRERVAGILQALGGPEVYALLEERGEVEVRCEFCNRAWRFDAVDIASLFSPGSTQPAPPGLH